MSLSSQVHMDPHLCLSLTAEHSTMDLLRAASVRRKNHLAQQLYFMSVRQLNEDKFGLFLAQALTKKGTGMLSTFFKRQFHESQAHPDCIGPLIDEVSAKLYLFFGIQTEQPHSYSMEMKLRVLDLSFGAPDALGFRRISVVQASGRTFFLESPIIMMSFTPAIWPSSGQICTLSMSDQGPNLRSILGLIDLPQQGNTAAIDFDSGGRIGDRGPCWPTAYVFASSGHMMVCFKPPDFSKTGSASAKPNNCVIFCAHSEKLGPVQCTTMEDYVKWIKSFFPPAFLNQRATFQNGIRCKDQETNYDSYLGCEVELLGHVHKYVVFELPVTIVAIKWPKDWHLRKELPRVKMSQYMYLNDLIPPAERQPMIDHDLVGSSVYVRLLQADGSVVIRRIELGHRLKDYRHCANCGKEETGKRRNNKGKRIAQFKVCRICKQFNFHLCHLDGSLACHYCAEKCQQMHWPTHKILHKRAPVQRNSVRVDVQITAQF